MSAVLQEVFLGDIPLERIELLTVIENDEVSVYSANGTVEVEGFVSKTFLNRRSLEIAWHADATVKMRKHNGFWISVDQPEDCLAIIVTVKP